MATASENYVQGYRYLKDENLREALKFFRLAYQDKPDHPRYQSFYGLCMALVERRFQQGLSLCISALDAEYFDPDLYLNVAQVHLSFGFKNEGIEYLRKGIRIDPSSEVILEELQRLGVRRKPVLDFLSRGHFLNRWLGQFRFSLLHREKLQEEDPKKMSKG